MKKDNRQLCIDCHIYSADFKQDTIFRDNYIQSITLKKNKNITIPQLNNKSPVFVIKKITENYIILDIKNQLFVRVYNREIGEPFIEKFPLPYEDLFISDKNNRGFTRVVVTKKPILYQQISKLFKIERRKDVPYTDERITFCLYLKEIDDD